MNDLYTLRDWMEKEKATAEAGLKTSERLEIKSGIRDHQAELRFIRHAIDKINELITANVPL